MVRAKQTARRRPRYEYEPIVKKEVSIKAEPSETCKKELTGDAQESKVRVGPRVGPGRPRKAKAMPVKLRVTKHILKTATGAESRPAGLGDSNNDQGGRKELMGTRPPPEEERANRSKGKGKGKGRGRPRKEHIKNHGSPDWYDALRAARARLSFTGLRFSNQGRDNHQQALYRAAVETMVQQQMRVMNEALKNSGSSLRYKLLHVSEKEEASSSAP